MLNTLILSTSTDTSKLNECLDSITNNTTIDRVRIIISNTDKHLDEKKSIINDTSFFHVNGINLRESLIKSVSRHNKYTLLLTDKYKFANPWSIEEIYPLDNRATSAIMLNLSTENSDVKTQNGLWQWQTTNGDGEWFRPISFNGSVCRTCDIYNQLTRPNYNNISDIEWAVNDIQVSRPLAFCYKYNRVIVN